MQKYGEFYRHLEFTQALTVNLNTICLYYLGTQPHPMPLQDKVLLRKIRRCMTAQPGKSLGRWVGRI